MTESQAALAIAGEGSTTAALSAMRLPELKAVAAKLGIKGAGSMRKSALVEAINAQRPGAGAEHAPQWLHRRIGLLRGRHQPDQVLGHVPHRENLTSG